MTERRETIDRDGAAIEESRQKLEALRQELAQRDAGLTEQERTLVEREKSVASQHETAQLFRGLIDNAVESFEKPLDIPKVNRNPAPPAEAEPQAETVDDDSDLDDATKEQLRVLRRMGNENKTDEELLAQVRAQKGSGDTPGKKGWFSRR